jgi:hypothetical protein
MRNDDAPASRRSRVPTDDPRAASLRRAEATPPRPPNSLVKGPAIMALAWFVIVLTRALLSDGAHVWASGAAYGAVVGVIMGAITVAIIAVGNLRARSNLS